MATTTWSYGTTYTASLIGERNYQFDITNFDASFPNNFNLLTVEYPNGVFSLYKQSINMYRVSSNYVIIGEETVQFTFIQPPEFTIPSNALFVNDDGVSPMLILSYRNTVPAGVMNILLNGTVYTSNYPSTGPDNIITFSQMVFPNVSALTPASVNIYGPIDSGSTIYTLFNAADTTNTLTSNANGYTINQDDTNQDVIVMANGGSHGFQRLNRNVYQNQVVMVSFMVNGNTTGDCIGIVGSYTQSYPQAEPNVSSSVPRNRDTSSITSNGHTYVGDVAAGILDINWNDGDTVTLIVHQVYGIQISVNGGHFSDAISFPPMMQPNGRLTYMYIYVSPVYYGTTYKIVPTTTPPTFDNTQLMAPWGLDFNTVVGKPFVITSTSLGIEWPDFKPSESYSIMCTNTDSGRVVGTNSTSGSFYVFTGLQPNTSYNFKLITGAMSWPLLLGQKTCGVGTIIRKIITGTPIVGSIPNPLLVPIVNLDTVETPRMIMIESIQISHSNNKNAIKSYTITSPDIAFSQNFLYQGDNFTYESNTINHSLGTPIPTELPPLENPDNLTFNIKFNTSYGTSIDPIGIAYYSITFVIYQYQLYLYGIS